MNALRHEDIYGTINYVNQSENLIKTFIYPHIIRELKTYFEQKMDGEKADLQARKMLLWEGNKKTTVSNVIFLGTQHRPDFLIKGKTINIAIEIKKGDKGSSVREGIGQSMVYSMLYDFTICLFIDTSKDKRILNSLQSKRETKFINDLWEKHNILFGII